MNLNTISLQWKARPVNAGTLAPRVANWPPPKFDCILFSALGPMQGPNVQHSLVLGADPKDFFYFSLDS
jgi:hypothetical protein